MDVVSNQHSECAHGRGGDVKKVVVIRRHHDIGMYYGVERSNKEDIQDDEDDKEERKLNADQKRSIYMVI